MILQALKESSFLWQDEPAEMDIHLCLMGRNMPGREKTTISVSEDRTRKTPKQARGKLRVDLILENTRDLLREEGIGALTTTAIAARAGIPVSSIYQYFPDKKAILMGLYADYLGSILDTYDEVERRYDPSRGWEDFFTEFYRLMHRAELQDKIHNELAKALYLYPELQEIDRIHQKKVVERTVSMLQAMGSKWRKPRLRRLVTFLYSVNTGIWSYRAQQLSSETELQEWEKTVWNAAVSTCFE